MTDGVYLLGRSAATAMEGIVRAEAAGVAMAWHGHGGLAADPVTMLGVALGRTRHITVGSSIVQAPTRHPLLLATQAAALASAAPGRFVLGIGPGDTGRAGTTWGVDFSPPLAAFRAWTRALRAALAGEAVVVDPASGFRGEGRLFSPVDVPVAIAATLPGIWAFCGEAADQVVTWVAPRPWIARMRREVLVPAAAQAGRPVPRVVAHVIVSTLPGAGETAGALGASILAGAPAQYGAMLAQCGFPPGGGWTRELADALCVHGSPVEMAAGLDAWREAGADDLLLWPVGPGAEDVILALAAASA